MATRKSSKTDADGWAGARFKKSELAEIIETGVDWVWETDAEHKYSYFSSNYQEVTGVDPNDLLGMSRADVFLTLAKPNSRMKQHLDDLKNHRPFRHFIMEARTKDNRFKWVSISGVPLFDEQDEFCGYRGTGSNIDVVISLHDELNETRAQLTETQTMLESIIESVDTGLIVYDENERLVVANAIMRSLYPKLAPVLKKGTALRDVLGHGFDTGQFDRVHGPGEVKLDREAWIDARVKELYSPYSEKELKLNDGRWLQLRSRRLDCGMIIGVRSDITALKEREQRYRIAAAATSLASAVIDGVDQAVFVKDEKLRFVSTNNTFEDMVGKRFSELQGATAVELFGEEGASFEVSERRVLETGEPFEDIDSYTDDEGNLRWRAVRKNRITSSDGKVYVAGFVSDVTDLKTKELEAKKARCEAENARARLQGAIDALDDGFALWDSEDRLIACNNAFRRQFSFLPSLAEGRTFDEMFLDFAKSGLVKEAVGREEEWVKEHSDKRAEELGQEIVFKTHDKRWMMRRDRITAFGDRVGIRTDISEIKRNEEQAKAARTRLVDVIESMPAGVVIYDHEDRFVLANSKIREALPAMVPAMEAGRSLRKALELAHDADYFRDCGDPETDALYDIDKDAWVDAYLQRYHQNYSVSQRRGADGRWYQAIDTRSADGTYIGVRIDITHQMEVQAETQAARQMLQDAIDAMDEQFVIFSADDHLEVGNRTFWRTCEGLPVKVGMSFDSMLELFADRVCKNQSDEEREDWFRRQIELRRDARENDGPIEVRSGSGRWYRIDIRRMSTGALLDIRAEITKEKHQALELECQKELSEQVSQDLQRTIDHMLMGTVLIDANLDTEIINSAYYRIWDVDPKRYPAGVPFADLVYANKDRGIREQDTASFEAYAEQHIAEVRAGSIEPRELTRADGMTLIYSVAELSGGKRLVTYFDITDQKKREALLDDAKMRAELADRAKSEFLANMSHEIRTPMNGVLGMAELLAKTELNGKQKTFTNIIVKSGNALLTIINDILDFSKIDAGQLALDPAPFNLAEAIEDVATLVSVRAKEKDIELAVRIAPDLPTNFVGDVGRIRQMVTNLMGNAVKFTDHGHVVVDVKGQRKEDKVLLRFSVEDTGIGIPGERLDSVFDKFSQVDASSTRRHEGTGLGLAITSRLVELMDGRIGAESTVGEGSTFWFEIELPICNKEDSEMKTPTNISGARVLIIDDNDINRSILMEQTASWSFDSCAANSGTEGLMILKAAVQYGLAVDCVVLDYQMPGMNGSQVAEAIRSDPEIAGTPIVLLTSVDQALSGADYRAMGISAHLVKPARSSDLLDAITEQIGKARGSLAQPGADTPAEPAATPDVSAAAASVADPAEVTDSAQLAAQDDVADYEARDPHASGGGRVDILVAEDNEVNQLVLSQILADSPYTFEMVTNGELAVEQWRLMEPRLVLMDVSMPNMNGLEATAHIRRTEQRDGRARTPVIGVTAHALKGDRERCLESGMDDYLSKPISPNALLTKIDEWLGGQKETRFAG